MAAAMGTTTASAAKTSATACAVSNTLHSMGHCLGRND